MQYFKKIAVGPIVLGIAGVILTVSLGQWQTRRAEQKIKLQKQFEQSRQAPPFNLTVEKGKVAVGLEWQHVLLQGEFLPFYTIYLDNRIRDGIPGFYVLTPFKLAGTEYSIVINRGWVARDVHDVNHRPNHGEISGIVEIEGILQKEISQTYLLSANENEMQKGVIWQRFGLMSYQRQMGLKLLPWIVFQLDQPNLSKDGLIRDWKLPELGIEKHRAYAFQWYAMAVMILILVGIVQWKKIRPSH